MRLSHFADHFPILSSRLSARPSGAQQASFTTLHRMSLLFFPGHGSVSWLALPLFGVSRYALCTVESYPSRLASSIRRLLLSITRSPGPLELNASLSLTCLKLLYNPLLSFVSALASVEALT